MERLDGCCGKFPTWGHWRDSDKGADASPSACVCVCERRLLNLNLRAALIRMASWLQSVFVYQRSWWAAHFLLGSTVNRPASLSSLRFYFTQAQTLLAGVWREGGRETDKGEICDQSLSNICRGQGSLWGFPVETLACSIGSRGEGGGKIGAFRRSLICMSAKQATQLVDFSLTGTQVALDIGVSIFMTTGGLHVWRLISSWFHFAIFLSRKKKI